AREMVRRNRRRNKAPELEHTTAQGAVVGGQAGPPAESPRAVPPASGKAQAPQVPLPLAPPPVHPPSPPTPPTRRLLRGHSFDPSTATQLETAWVGEITYKVPWERLEPGPVGEYVEVVDVDPPSHCYYAPVDLDHPRVLAQNGLAPSEGNPQFHQQMSYAV